MRLRAPAESAVIYYPDQLGMFPSGMIVMWGKTIAEIPTAWVLCDGDNDTPDLRDVMVIGTATPDTTGGELTHTHTGHSNHSIGQPAAHSAHSMTQPSAHSAHVVTQPSAHDAHAETQPSAHDNHEVTQPAEHTGFYMDVTESGTAQTVGGAASTMSGRTHTHESVVHMTHTGFAVSGHSAHAGFAVDGHSAHAGWNVNAHSVHSGFAVDAHSAHSGLALDAHSAHVAATHLNPYYALPFIMKT